MHFYVPWELCTDLIQPQNIQVLKIAHLLSDKFFTKIDLINTKNY